MVSSGPASVTVRAPAKVNLSLSVGPRRTDGFHELVTVFHAVSLHDTVVATQAPAGHGISITVEGDEIGAVPTNESNLVWAAAQLVAKAIRRPADVHLHVSKNIPVAGGMAGGSADGAAALVACDALWGAGLGRTKLEALAVRLGSDVPFALHGGTAIGRGRGEQVTPALARGEFHWVFAFADWGLSTPDVYTECDRLRAQRDVVAPAVADELMAALRSGRATSVGAGLHNDLQEAALSLRPRLKLTLEAGADAGALGSIVSGSGPTCAFLARDDEHALDIAVALSASGACRTVTRATGPVHGARVVDAVGLVG